MTMRPVFIFLRMSCGRRLIAAPQFVTGRSGLLDYVPLVPSWSRVHYAEMEGQDRGNAPALCGRRLREAKKAAQQRQSDPL